MPTVARKCCNCDAPIYFEPNNNSTICQYCGMQNDIEKTEIHNHQHQHNNFTGANVVMNNSDSIENQLQNAENHLEILKNYVEAEKLFRNISEKASTEYRAWWGLVRARTEEFTYLQTFDYELTSQYAQYAYNVAKDSVVKNEIKNKWQEYNRRIVEHKEQYKQQVDNCTNEIASLKNRILQNENSMEMNKRKLRSKEDCSCTYIVFAMILTVACFVPFIVSGTLERFIIEAVLVTMIFVGLAILFWNLYNKNNKKIAYIKYLIESHEKENDKFERQIADLEKIKSSMKGKFYSDDFEYELEQLSDFCEYNIT